jgi:hypothetical protein
LELNNSGCNYVLKLNIIVFGDTNQLIIIATLTKIGFLIADGRETGLLKFRVRAYDYRSP